MLLHRTLFGAAAALFLVACAHQEVKPTPSPTAARPIAKAPEAAAPAVVTKPSEVSLSGPTLSPIHFDFDKSIIHAEDEAVLNAIGDYMHKFLNVSVTIAGHCDERGTVEYNIALGDRRAWAAREFLTRLGIDPARIKTISYGEAKPADPGHDEAAWAKNRRDEFQLEEGKRAQK